MGEAIARREAIAARHAMRRRIRAVRNSVFKDATLSLAEHALDSEKPAASRRRALPPGPGRIQALVRRRRRFGSCCGCDRGASSGDAASASVGARS